MKRILNKKRKAYVITFEVLITLILVTMFLNATTWILSTINTQKFINTTMISTATSIAKWGGTESKAYEVNGVSSDLIQTSQIYLDKYAKSFDPYPNDSHSGPIIKGGPSVISNSNNQVWCTIEWKYPKIFGIQISGVQTRTITLDGIMQPGSLLY